MDVLLSNDEAARLSAAYGRETLKEELRRAMAAGEVLADPLLARAGEALARRFAPTLTRVLNGTGVLLHTNLGRAVLGPDARAALEEALPGYCSVEFDAETGERGRRQDHVRGAARGLFSAEDALAVNNNASAVFLALSALARGRPVVVSRGELVAIGGSFRIPDILAASGAELLEVGTTNRTTRATGCAAREATRDARPTTSPACGPQSSLSPENVTRSAPSARQDATVGSPGTPNSSSGSTHPVPWSCSHGMPASRARAARARGSGRSVKPRIS